MFNPYFMNIEFLELRKKITIKIEKKKIMNFSKDLVKI